jgi:hypothetical protein
MRWMTPYDLVLSMFALAVTAVMLVAGELDLVTRAPATGDPHTAGIDSNIIDPVVLSCLHATGGNATAKSFG